MFEHWDSTLGQPWFWDSHTVLGQPSRLFGTEEFEGKAPSQGPHRTAQVALRLSVLTIS